MTDSETLVKEFATFKDKQKELHNDYEEHCAKYAVIEKELKELHEKQVELTKQLDNKLQEFKDEKYKADGLYGKVEQAAKRVELMTEKAKFRPEEMSLKDLVGASYIGDKKVDGMTAIKHQMEKNIKDIDKVKDQYAEAFAEAKAQDYLVKSLQTEGQDLAHELNKVESAIQKKDQERVNVMKEVKNLVALKKNSDEKYAGMKGKLNELKTMLNVATVLPERQSKWECDQIKRRF